ncbi:MAG TPA: aminotransferase class V-fold PLP-dependent enzyme [Ktedonobacterales bacterium]|jgi:aromatic-L-amino-acid decarboxylase
MDSMPGNQPLDPGQMGLGDMDPEAFRRYGHQLIEWVAAYLADMTAYPVLSKAAPGAIKAALPDTPPRAPESMAAILEDFERVIVPGITHWNHPGFMAYFGISGSGPGILGELLSAALNVNAMLWRTSPSATELEEVALGWLRQMIDLPDTFMGVINDTASASSLYALAAAREAIEGLQAREEGLAGRPGLPRLRAYASVEAHSSIDKAAIVLGIGQAGLRKIPTDDEFRMDARALAAAIEEDLAAGWRPFAVAATVGTTSTTSIDPVPAIADLCEQYGLWLHVDGAYGGPAAILPELRPVLAGCDRADSIVVNPHKWLFTPIDCSVLYCRRPQMLRQAFSLVPAFLQTSVDDQVVNLMDYGTSLGRRFRALKLWMILRYFGQEGLARRLREHRRLAQMLVDWIDAAPEFERMAPAPFSTVCFRYHPLGESDEARLDALNERLMEYINASGEIFISHTKVHEHFTLRCAIGNIRTTDQHVLRFWELLQGGAAQVAS